MHQYTILLFMMMIINVATAQDKNPGSGLNVFINSGIIANPIYIIDNEMFNESIASISPDSISATFIEGDSSYLRRIYGTNPDTSLIRQYFGEQRDRGIVFMFTNDKVQVITTREFEKCLKNEDCRIVFKIDNESLSENRYELDRLNVNTVEKIQMVKDFKLTKWDTGNKDEFILFLIKTKNKR